MSLAVLAPFRADTDYRARVQKTTRRLWAAQGVEVIYADDGLRGEFFSYARAANRARAMTDADCLLVYNCDALPLPAAALEELEAKLTSGLPWSVLFEGQRKFTPQQTERLIAGAELWHVGEPGASVAMGREALLGIRADVWDDLRGMDERFIGWGPEDVAWHHVLRTVYPDGCDEPAHGFFWALWHPEAPMSAWDRNSQLWKSYPRDVDAETMRAFYRGRP